MRALDRKLLRDLRLMWSQSLTIALVVASGIGGFVTTLSAVDSLARARETYYAEGAFADLFAQVRRAPDALGEELRALPGVADAQTTVEHTVRIEVAGSDDAILGHLIGVDPQRPPRLNRITLRNGRMLGADEVRGEGLGGESLDDESLSDEGARGEGARGEGTRGEGTRGEGTRGEGTRGEGTRGEGTRGEGTRGEGTIDALVSEGFAQARGLKPGARLTALIDGNRRSLRIVGVALSPEYVFAGFGGMPDMRGFGVFWVDHDTLAAAYDMRGAFNRIALKLTPGASPEAALDALDRRIAPYGGREAYGREDQTSHAMLENEIKEQRVMGTVLPAIFLAVAAFLLNVVISRLVATQREQIAALKALGYPNREIAAFYLKLVLAIVALGLLLGFALGDRLGAMLTGLYAEFFHFPRFEHRLAPSLLLIGTSITVVTAVLGTLNPIVAIVRLAPAEAMRPPAPGRYRPTWVERLGLRRLPTALRMILRNMERRPLRTALSIAGVAAAVAIVVLGHFFRDAIGSVVDSKFNVEMRSDVLVWTAEPVADGVRREIARLPGAIAVESGRDVAVRFVNGHRRERGVIQGYAARPELRRIVDVDHRQTLPDADGLVLTDRLAEKLGLRVGDRVTVEVLEGRTRTRSVPLRAVVREMMGLNAYMERRALNRLLGEDDVSTLFATALERGGERRFLAAAMDVPRIVGAFSKATLWRNMQEISARNIRIMSTILTVFATVIAVGVVYNNARIALAERTWELASLRVMGFARAEVSWLLLGEMAIGIAIALPLGMWLGNGLVHLLVELLRSDQFLFPVEIRPRTYAWAGLSVLAAGVASALVVRRRIDRLDMVAALKTRE